MYLCKLLYNYIYIIYNHLKYYIFSANLKLQFVIVTETGLLKSCTKKTT